ncbi:MAG: hypothetical protein NC489_08655 [Ruminococcus flavefaciens]|nr:hypothetical protein [Ruminococcus flavefaciens]
MYRNMMLQEAIELTATAVKPDEIASEIKKCMNTCKLTKFKSESECGRFYSAFFLSTLNAQVTPTVEQWGTIYTTLLSNDSFCNDLAVYMVMYRPAIFTGIFAPLWNLVQSELANMKNNQIRYLSLTKAMFTMLQTRLNGVGQIIRSQVHDTESLKFIGIVEQVLTQFIFDLTTLTQAEVAKMVKPEDITVGVRYTNKPLAEDVQELLAILASADEWINEDAKRYMELNEGIVSNAAMKAKEAGIAMKKAERNFDEFVMKRVKKMRQDRQNRKHSEMVGESLQITHEIKRLLKSGGLAVINPALGVMHWIVTLFIDRHTDAKDRAVLVRQLKEEIEIIDEKIAMAERNGQDKERIELIRVRQKYIREYDRINKIRFDPQTRDRLANMT